MSMEWLFGLAFVPFLVCGLMCLGGMALVVFGRRRDGRHRQDECSASTADHDDPARLTPR